MKSKLSGCSSVRILVLFGVMVLLGACSTKKNTFVNRSYHTVTTKFNGYFNAHESFTQGHRRLTSQHVENYEGILSIFPYGTRQQAASVSQYMDVAYQKASIAIRRHSMNIRGVEYNPYIDESYFLIARSHFFKADYNLAILTFEYIVRQYQTPLAYQAKVWIAKSQMFQERYDRARQMLEVVERDIQQGLAPKEAIRMYHLVAADLEMRQTNFQEAIGSLQQAIQLTDARQERTRLTFILGQLYQQVQNYSDAQATYERVLKMNPSFNLAFQARIRMAMAYDPGSGNSRAIRSELTGMLRDDKNKAYQDQIYYALAQMALRQGHQEEAIDLLLESTAASEENRLQKGLSYYHLAQIYYQKPDYLKASVYYDSTVTYLPQSFENFQQISTTRGMLSELAANLRIIAVEDSLQRLAALPEQQRNELVDEMIATLREQEAEEREAERNRQLTRQSMTQTRRPGAQRDEGWYFYNPSSITFGRTEFLSRFGERPLEDLWRISNKQVMAMGMDQQDTTGQQADAQGPAAGRFDRSNLLRNIPVSEEMMQLSNQRMAQAYYHAGLIFRDRFQDYQQAVNSFESLVSRFPDSPHVLYSLYFLYNLHRSQGDLSRAETLKNQIISKFPDSEFAQILGDPEYLENLKDQQLKAHRIYQTAYAAFQGERYQEALDLIPMADSMDLEPELEARFAYLRALALGRLDRENEFREQLQQVVQLYEGTPVYQPASVLLASRSDDMAMSPMQEPEVEPGSKDNDSPFSFKADAVHFFVVVIDVQQIDARLLRNFINEFNQENFADREFSMSNIFLDDKNQLITLTNFESMNLGMEYYYQLMASQGLKEFDGGAMQAFLISVENYPVFYQQKNIDEYQNFFQRRYLRN